MSHDHERVQDMDLDLQQTLDGYDHELCELYYRVVSEQQAWVVWLTSARKIGPHKLERGATLQTIHDIEMQTQALGEQLKAYNTRISAVQERGTDHPQVMWDDLLELDNVRTVSMETASSYARRLIISARLEINILAATLQKVEDLASLAYQTLVSMAYNIGCRFKGWRERPHDRPKGMEEIGQQHILMLKAVMARLGMRMVRQRLIWEYFGVADVEQHDLLNAGLAERLDTAAHVHSDQDANDAVQYESEVVEYVAGQRLDPEDEWSDTDISNAEANGKRYGQGEKRQTCITNYFSPLPWT